MKQLKNKKLFAFILSIMVFSFAHGCIFSFTHPFFWLLRWRKNPVEETSLYYLSDNQPSKLAVYLVVVNWSTHHSPPADSITFYPQPLREPVNFLPL